MYACGSTTGYKDVTDHIRMKTLVHGTKTHMVEFRLQKGADLPAHHHPHEQTGYLVSGRMALTVDDRVYDVRPGDSWCIPGGATHAAVAREDSVAIEVFAPVREDYLP